MKELTGFQRDLLYIIADQGQPSGQDVRRELEEYYDKKVNHGRLYPNLDTLVEEDYVQKGEKDQRTNCYVITTKGVNEIQTRDSWTDDIEIDDAAVV